MKEIKVGAQKVNTKWTQEMVKDVKSFKSLTEILDELDNIQQKQREREEKINILLNG